jgi:hypothetical protein
VERQSVDGGLRELASGVDALYLSGRASVPLWLLAALEGARKQAEKTGRDEPLWLGHTEFGVADRGFGRYRYTLNHENGQVGVSRSDRLPAFRIQPRAQFLHGVGALNGAEWFRDQLEPACGAVDLTVSRVDLFSDWQGWSLCGDDRHRFVCRAKSRVTYEENDSFTGFRFGGRKMNTVSARIYDKTLEMKHSNAGYWEDIWGPSYDRSEPVHRVEFELGRQGLSEFGLRGPQEVVGAAGGLWSYCTGKWLSLRNRTGDATHARWPEASEWRDIRRARLADEGHGLERMRKGRRRATLEGLTPILVGCMSTFAVLSGTTAEEDTCEQLVYLLRGYGFHTGFHFEERVVARRRELPGL